MQTITLIIAIILLFLTLAALAARIRMNTEIVRGMSQGFKFQGIILKRLKFLGDMERLGIEGKIQTTLFNPDKSLGLSEDFKIEIFSDGQCRLLDRKDTKLGFHQVARCKDIAELIATLQGADDE